MKTGICELAFIPMRAGLSHKTEMINQLLFGEVFEVLINRSEWLKIRLLHDDYEGWVEESAVTLLADDSNIIEEFGNYYVCSEVFNLTINNVKDSITIPNGSKIPVLAFASGGFTINQTKYSIPQSLKQIEYKDSRLEIIKAAQSFLNCSYLWGGRTSWGVDCSGFSQYLYSLIGIKLPRDASQQVSFGKTLNFVSEAQAGDLAFFDNEEGLITHVGIIYEPGKIIHSSGKVKIDTIDHQGIYNKTLKKYTHNLRVVKSIL